MVLFCAVFFVLAREERTAVFFVTGCALLLFFIESCLFAFFDGDTDDLHGGGVAVVGVARRNGHQHVQPFHDLTEDAVLVVEMRGGTMGNEKL